MTQYLISFDDGWMDFPDDELPQVAADVRVVRREAKATGIWVYSTGLLTQTPSIVARDGSVRDHPHPASHPHLGGFAVLDVATREDALHWAARIAVACRCAQELYEVLPEPADETESGAAAATD